MKKHPSAPWLAADVYGRSLPSFTVSLLVHDVPRSVAFYTQVLAARVHYADVDFAALEVSGTAFMLHADHTYDHHAWYPELSSGVRRGLGAELRLRGPDPEEVARRAASFGATVLKPPTVTKHGWHEVIVGDPDGYAWAVGVSTLPA